MRHTQAHAVWHMESMDLFKSICRSFCHTYIYIRATQLLEGSSAHGNRFIENKKAEAQMHIDRIGADKADDGV